MCHFPEFSFLQLQLLPFKWEIKMVNLTSNRPRPHLVTRSNSRVELLSSWRGNLSCLLSARTKTPEARPTHGADCSQGLSLSLFLLLYCTPTRCTYFTLPFPSLIKQPTAGAVQHPHFFGRRGEASTKIIFSNYLWMEKIQI